MGTTLTIFFIAFVLMGLTFAATMIGFRAGRESVFRELDNELEKAIMALEANLKERKAKAKSKTKAKKATSK